MADIGDASKKIVGTKWELRKGADTYILKLLASLKLSRTKFRDGLPSGPSISFGKGDHECNGVLSVSTDQISGLVALNTLDANSALPSNTYHLIAFPIDGAASIDISFVGELSELEFFQEDIEGALRANFHIDITSEIPTVT